MLKSRLDTLCATEMRYQVGIIASSCSALALLAFSFSVLAGAKPISTGTFMSTITLEIAEDEVNEWRPYEWTEGLAGSQNSLQN